MNIVWILLATSYSNPMIVVAKFQDENSCNTARVAMEKISAETKGFAYLHGICIPAKNTI